MMTRIKFFSIFIIALLIGGGVPQNNVYSQGSGINQQSKQINSLTTASITAGKIDSGYIKIDVSTKSYNNCETFYSPKTDINDVGPQGGVTPPVVQCTQYTVNSKITNTNTPIMGKKYQSEFYIGLIKFDLSSIPKDAVIQSVSVNNMDYGGVTNPPPLSSIKGVIGTPKMAWASINNDTYVTYNDFTYDYQYINSYFNTFKDWKSTVQEWVLTGINNGIAVGYKYFSKAAVPVLIDTYDWSKATLSVTYSVDNITRPTPPSNLTYSNVTSSSIDLKWDASTDNNIVYDVYRNSALIGTTRLTSYSVNDIEPNTEYKFTVQAKNQAGILSEQSNVLVAKTTVLPPLSDIDFLSYSSVVKGTINVSGWALDGYGIDKVEVCIDGIIMGQAVYGDAREDVYNRYKKYNNHNSGFHYILDTLKLIEGKHSISIISTDKNGVRTNGDNRDFIVENAVISKYQYDKNGRLVKIDLPLGKSIEFIYDKNGNLTKKILIN